MALKPVSVSRLNQYLKRILQTDPLLGNVLVEGEISNLKYHSSGHVFFALKDENSRVNCFLPADQCRSLRFALSDGMQVVVSGYVNIYERQGSYSLNVRSIEVQGQGSLSIAFEELKKRLEKEGLFARENKKPIPVFPKTIAVVTSPTGAAVRDIIKIIKSRNTYADIRVFPCLVQGPEAAGDIARCIDTVNRLYPETDVMIVGRGGGSMEELWAFNEEIVARSIFRSEIPVISAVGHETDFTIADFVADLRAETPTAAAQAACADTESLIAFAWDKLQTMSQTLFGRLENCTLRLQQNNREQMLLLLKKRIQLCGVQAESAAESMHFQIERTIQEAEHRLAQAGIMLEGLDPYGPLSRGYGMVFSENGKPMTSARGAKPGDAVRISLADGSLSCRVEEILPGEIGKRKVSDHEKARAVN